MTAMPTLADIGAAQDQQAAPASQLTGRWKDLSKFVSNLPWWEMDGLATEYEQS